MTLLLKDPEAVLDYLIDWGADYLGADAIIDSQWTVQPDEPLGVMLTDSGFSAATATAKAAGGIPGRRYRLVNEVLLASGRRDRRSITLRVEKR